MSVVMDEENKRWTARRKSALVLEILRGKTTVAEASRAYHLRPIEIESWAEDVRGAMWRFLIDYNEHRLHDALGGMAPAEYRHHHRTRGSTFEVSA